MCLGVSDATTADLAVVSALCVETDGDTGDSYAGS